MRRLDLNPQPRIEVPGLAGALTLDPPVVVG